MISSDSFRKILSNEEVKAGKDRNEEVSPLKKSSSKFKQALELFNKLSVNSNGKKTSGAASKVGGGESFKQVQSRKAASGQSQPRNGEPFKEVSKLANEEDRAGNS